MAPFFKMEELEEYLHQDFKGIFYEPEGQNHYRYLHRLCEGVELVFDVGTYKAASAVAMSSAKKVYTFDLEEYTGILPENVEQVVSSDFTTHPEVLNAEIILIDVDPHDGKQEKYFLNRLVEMDYKGLIIFDDIYLDRMKVFWDSLTLDKQDVTEIGHYTGTGLVFL